MWASDPWSWAGLWHWMGPFLKLILLLLAVMFVHAYAICAERIWRFEAATRQLPSLLRIVDRTEVSSTIISALAAAKSVRHPLARILTAGLEAFRATPSFFTDTEALGSAHGAVKRAVSLASAEMKYGFGTVATISALAPFVGLSGTLIGLLNAFSGISMQRDAARALVAGRIAVALIPTAFSLIVGVLAYSIYNHLVRRMELFRVQTTTVSNDVLTYLHRRLGERTEVIEATVADATALEARFDSYSVLLFSVGGVWLYVFWVLALGVYWSLTHPYY